MRAFPAFVGGLALWANRTSGRRRRWSWCVMAVHAAGTEPAGATNGIIGSRVTAFRTKVVTVTMAEAQGGTIRIQISALSSLRGGWSNR